MATKKKKKTKNTMVKLPSDINKALNKIMPISIIKARQTLSNYETKLALAIEEIDRKISVELISIDGFLSAEVDNASKQDCVQYSKTLNVISGIRKEQIEHLLQNNGIQVTHTQNYGHGQKKMLKKDIKFKYSHTASLIKGAGKRMENLEEEKELLIKKQDVLLSRMKGEKPSYLSDLEKVWN